MTASPEASEVVVGTGIAVAKVWARKLVMVMTCPSSAALPVDTETIEMISWGTHFVFVTAGMYADDENGTMVVYV